LPINNQWFAIGSSTANELKHFYIEASFSDNGVDSEALLDMEYFSQCEDEKILIIKGLDGRRLIQEQLNDAGAITQTLDVYQRICPEYK
ncbi:MAG: uroporphyrinogen-III synthase, partial [Endozoicomonas sp.]